MGDSITVWGEEHLVGHGLFAHWWDHQSVAVGHVARWRRDRRKTTAESGDERTKPGGVVQKKAPFDRNGRCYKGEEENWSVGKTHWENFAQRISRNSFRML